MRSTVTKGATDPAAEAAADAYAAALLVAPAHYARLESIGLSTGGVAEELGSRSRCSVPSSSTTSSASAAPRTRGRGSEATSTVISHAGRHEPMTPLA